MRGAGEGGRAWAARGEGLRLRGLSLTAGQRVSVELPRRGRDGLERGGMAGGESASTGGAESRCRAGPPLVPRRRMEFELLENDVLESLEDLGYVSGGGGAGRPGMGHSASGRGRCPSGGPRIGAAPGMVPFHRSRPQSGAAADALGQTGQLFICTALASVSLLPAS